MQKNITWECFSVNIFRDVAFEAPEAKEDIRKGVRKILIANSLFKLFRIYVYRCEFDIINKNAAIDYGLEEGVDLFEGRSWKWIPWLYLLRTGMLSTLTDVLLM